MILFLVDIFSLGAYTKYRLAKERRFVNIFRTIPIKARFSQEELSFWVLQCEVSNSLYNSGIYEFKQRHYQQLESTGGHSTYWREDDLRTGWKLRKITATNYYEVERLLKPSEHYKIMAAQSAQQTLKSVQEAISSFNKLVDLFFKGEVDRPRIPGYRKSGGLYSVVFPSQALIYKDGYVYPSISRLAKPDVRREIKIEVPEFVDFNLVKEIRIRPSRGEFWIDWVCDDGKELLENNPNFQYHHFLAIDRGVKYWLSCVTTRGKSFIIEAPKLKTELFKYRDKVAQYKEGKNQDFWDDYLDSLTSKRNLIVRDAVNKACRFLINHCLRNRIGSVVIGWNKGNKQNINLGRKNNYEVVTMPTARLIQRLKELCNEYGIKLHVITEEYTSKASFLDRDELHKLGEKPLTWKPSGKRINRDQYRTKTGLIVHADINAAANILRKMLYLVGTARTKISLFLKRIDGVLTDPKQYNVFRNLRKKFRDKSCVHPQGCGSARLQTA